MKISIKELEIWTDELHCLKAVEEDGDALRYVAKAFWNLFKNMISGL